MIPRYPFFFHPLSRTTPPSFPASGRTRWAGLAAIIISCCVSLPLPAQVILSEIMFHAPDQEAYEEFIELYNSSPDLGVDLTGWTLGDQIEQDLLVDQGHGLWLPPQSYALVLDPGYWDHSSIYDALMDQDALLLVIADGAFGAFGLRNDPPDTVLLRNPAGDTVACFTYSPGNPDGYSEEKIRLDGGDDPANWSDSRSWLGTPGFVNSVQPLPANLALTGLQADPHPLPFGADLHLTATIRNVGLSALPPGEVLFAWTLPGDGGADSLLGSATFPALPPDDSACVGLSLDGLPAGPHRLCAGHSLSDDAPEDDTLSLLLPGGYPSGSLVFSEMMIRPGPGQGEWVELLNPGGFPVDLLGFAFRDADTAHTVVLTDGSLPLEPGQYALLAEDSTIFAWNPPPEAQIIVLGTDWPALNDGGDAPTLTDAAGDVQEAVPYYGWNVPAELSLERLYPGLPAADPVNWRPSTDPAGSTPGRPGSFVPVPAPAAASLSHSPDPFNPDEQALQIHLELPPDAASAALLAFDLRGRRLKVLFDGPSAGGVAEFLWDGRDSQGRRLPPGLYLLLAEFRDSAGRRRSTIKETLVIAGKL